MPAKKSKRKRIRLSFIGGRRPSLLPSAKRKEQLDKENEGDIVDKREAILKIFANEEEVQEIPKISGDKEDVEGAIKILVDGREVNETTQIFADEGEVRKTPNRSTDEGDVKGATKTLVDEREEKETTQILTDEGEVKELQKRSADEEIKETIKEVDEEKVKEKINVIQLELDKWSNLLQQNTYVVSCKSPDDVNIPVELSNSLLFSFENEINEMQLMYDSWNMNVELLMEKQKKLCLVKELVHKQLEKQYVDIKFDPVDSGQVQQTPRHLIKKILKPK